VVYFKKNIYYLFIVTIFRDELTNKTANNKILNSAGTSDKTIELPVYKLFHTTTAKLLSVRSYDIISDEINFQLDIQRRCSLARCRSTVQTKVTDQSDR